MTTLLTIDLTDSTEKLQIYIELLQRVISICSRSAEPRVVTINPEPVLLDHMDSAVEISPSIFKNQIAPVAPDGVLVDAAGVPWNPELHSRTYTKRADGTWKPRRSSPGAVKNVLPPVPFKASEKLGPPVVLGVQAQSGKPGDQQPIVVTTFTELMAKIRTAISQQLLTTDDVSKIIGNAGLTNVLETQKNLELIPHISTALDDVINKNKQEMEQ